MRSQIKYIYIIQYRPYRQRASLARRACVSSRISCLTSCKLVILTPPPLGGGKIIKHAKCKITLLKSKKAEKITLSRARGVVTQLGESLYPPPPTLGVGVGGKDSHPVDRRHPSTHRLLYSFLFLKCKIALFTCLHPPNICLHPTNFYFLDISLVA